MIPRIITLRIFIIFSVLFLLSTSAYSETPKTNAPNKEIKVRIQWPEVENAVSYRVLIRNWKGKIVIKTNTDSNSIELDVIPGKYSMRIGAVNKFQKIGSWSDWASITVEKPKPPPIIVEKKPEKAKKRPYMPFKIGAGGAYVYILPDLDEILDNTFSSGNLLVSYGLGKLIPFSFFRHIGIEAESVITWIDGKDKTNGNSLEKTDILAGGNVFFTTDLNFPLNLIIRAGGGVSFTHIEYKDVSGTATIDSQDMYYKVGSAIEFTYSHFFAEIGADYIKIMYIGDQFSAVNCIIRAGVRF